jgi:hypothetical protein
MIPPNHPTVPPLDIATAHQLVSVLEGLSVQSDLSGLLAGAAAAGVTLGTPWFLACLLREESTGAWYLTALLDPVADPVDLSRLRLPTGPFAFRPPDDARPRPLPALFEATWGTEKCERLVGALGVSLARGAVIPGPQGPRGALVGLAPDGATTPALAGVLVHASSVAVRLLPSAESEPGQRILSMAALAERAAVELARAKRYERPLSIVSVLVPPEQEIAPVGACIARTLREWDFHGGVPWNKPWQIDSARPRFAAVLPETTADNAIGFLRRLAPRLPECSFGVAAYPADGATFEALLTRACHSGRESAQWLLDGDADAGGTRERSARRSWWQRVRSSA